MRKRIKHINKVMDNPISHQKKVWKYLIKKGEKTVFGTEHQFYKINNYAAFKKQIPIREYAEISDYIIKMRQGERNILWPGYVNKFAKSSGCLLYTSPSPRD